MVLDKKCFDRAFLFKRERNTVHEAQDARTADTKNKAMAQADPELALFDLLWHRMDHHKRLELSPAWHWDLDQIGMDDGNIGCLPDVSLVAHLARKDRYGRHRALFGQASVSQAQHAAAPTDPWCLGSGADFPNKKPPCQ